MAAIENDRETRLEAEKGRTFEVPDSPNFDENEEWTYIKDSPPTTKVVTTPAPLQEILHQTIVIHRNPLELPAQQKIAANYLDDWYTPEERAQEKAESERRRAIMEAMTPAESAAHKDRQLQLFKKRQETFQKRRAEIVAEMKEKERRQLELEERRLLKEKEQLAIREANKPKVTRQLLIEANVPAVIVEEIKAENALPDVPPSRPETEAAPAPAKLVQTINMSPSTTRKPSKKKVTFAPSEAAPMVKSAPHAPDAVEPRDVSKPPAITKVKGTPTIRETKHERKADQAVQSKAQSHNVRKPVAAECTLDQTMEEPAITREAVGNVNASPSELSGQPKLQKKVSFQTERLHLVEEVKQARVQKQDREHNHAIDLERAKAQGLERYAPKERKRESKAEEQSVAKQDTEKQRYANVTLEPVNMNRSTQELAPLQQALAAAQSHRRTKEDAESRKEKDQEVNALGAPQFPEASRHQAEHASSTLTEPAMSAPALPTPFLLAPVLPAPVLQPSIQLTRSLLSPEVEDLVGAVLSTSSANASSATSTAINNEVQAPPAPRILPGSTSTTDAAVPQPAALCSASDDGVPFPGFQSSHETLMSGVDTPVRSQSVQHHNNEPSNDTKFFFGNQHGQISPFAFRGSQRLAENAASVSAVVQTRSSEPMDTEEDLSSRLLQQAQQMSQPSFTFGSTSQAPQKPMFGFGASQQAHHQSTFGFTAFGSGNTANPFGSVPRHDRNGGSMGTQHFSTPQSNDLNLTASIDLTMADSAPHQQLEDKMMLDPAPTSMPAVQLMPPSVKEALGRDNWGRKGPKGTTDFTSVSIRAESSPAARSSATLPAHPSTPLVQSQPTVRNTTFIADSLWWSVKNEPTGSGVAQKAKIVVDWMNQQFTNFPEKQAVLEMLLPCFADLGSQLQSLVNYEPSFWTCPGAFKTNNTREKYMIMYVKLVLLDTSPNFNYKIRFNSIMHGLRPNHLKLAFDRHDEMGDIAHDLKNLVETCFGVETHSHYYTMIRFSRQYAKMRHGEAAHLKDLIDAFESHFLVVYDGAKLEVRKDLIGSDVQLKTHWETIKRMMSHVRASMNVARRKFDEDGGPY